LKSKSFAAGVGAITAIGNSINENIHALQNSSSGIGDITLFETVHKGHLPVGEVKLSNSDLASVLQLDPKLTRTALLGIWAAREAIKNAGIDLKKWRTGLISGTTVGGMDKSEQYYEKFLLDENTAPLDEIRNHECGKVTERIADDLGIKDFISTINTACSSSANSIILGSKLIGQDQLDVVIAGGTDSLTRFTLNGFNSLMILDSEPCRPFDETRGGLNLGEGAGYIVLVSDKVLRNENCQPLALVSGFANTNDAFHQTASSPEGKGSFQAMLEALTMSGLSFDDIDYINLHGTGTQNNDASEGSAVQRLFESGVPRASSTKAFTGHTLGASGGIEAVFSILAIRDKMVYPNLRFKNRISDLTFSPIPEFESGIKVNNVMSNSFGFGGNCSSLIFSAC